MKLRRVSESIVGVQQLLRDLAGANVVVKIRSFASSVEVVHEWTRDLASASRAVATLKARGGTALNRAVAAGTDDLQDCDGRRRLLVYSDGRNTTGRVKLNPLFQRCRDEGIEISAIGLTTDELDVATLTRMAKATGGSYAEARSADDLTARFEEASGRLRRSYYRLILVVPPGSPADDEPRLVVTIGRGPHALRLTEIVARSAQASRAK